MFLISAALLVSAQAAADQQPAAPVPSVAPAPKKERKICKLDDTSGTRMAKRLCLTDEEWAQRNPNMMDNSRAGLSGKAQDH
jgi:hypothetical protein